MTLDKVERPKFLHEFPNVGHKGLLHVPLDRRVTLRV
jgi:hypothetical protein